MVEALGDDADELFTILRPWDEAIVAAKGDVLVAFGWAMAEDLLKLGSR